MPLRLRPFGVGGSVFEVVGGLLILRNALGTDEDEFSGWFATVEVVIGMLLLCAGIAGIAAATRRARMARSNRNRDA
jgi:hypothetical protein